LEKQEKKDFRLGIFKKSLGVIPPNLGCYPPNLGCYPPFILLNKVFERKNGGKTGEKIPNLRDF